MALSTSIEQITKRHPNIKPQDAEDLKVINEALDELFTRGTFASRDPYILSIPQEERYAYQHRSGQHARQFAQGTPFSSEREREGLQYQTYKYYEPGKTLFKQYPSTDELEQEEAVTKPKIMSSAAPKKVISFGAYKKQKQGIESTDTQPGPEEVEKRTNRAPGEHVPAADVYTPEERQQQQYGEELNSDLKRKRDDAESESQPNGGHDRRSSLKRQRLSNGHQERSPSPHSQLTSAVPSEDDSLTRDKTRTRQARNMPKKLSPLPEKQMPNRLSPTLPNSIEDALSDRRERKARRKDVSSTNSDDALNGFGTRKKSSGDKKSNMSLSEGRVNENHSSDGERDDEAVRRPKTKKPSYNEEEHHSAKFRDRHPGQPPTTKTTSKEQHSPLDSKHGSSREEDLRDRSSRKEKPLPNKKPPEDRPQTPVSAALVSPSMRKTLSAANGTAMRTPSTEPITPKQAVRPSAKNPTQQLWVAEQKRLEERGREMKHASSAFAKASEPRLAAVRALESFMCYLLGFTCADQVSFTADEPKHHPASIKPWRSLGPFYQFVERSCKPYPQLVGITGVLGQAFSAHILELLEALPADLPSRETIIDVTTLMRQAGRAMKKHLHAEILRIEFPGSWRVGLRDGAEDRELVAGKLLQGDFQLPTDVLTTPVQAVRASLALLEEWIMKEGMDIKIELESTG